MNGRLPILSMLFIFLVAITFAGQEQRGFAEQVVEKVIFTKELSMGEKMEAEAILNRFFSAQITGDTKTIEKLLGGDLLKKRRRLLNNPSYSGFLRRTYKNIRFKIMGYKKINEDTIQVKVMIIMNEHESNLVNFILIKEAYPVDLTLSYRIHSQREVADQSY